MLDVKEFNLALDEEEFIRDGGVVDWNTETGEDFPTDSDEEYNSDEEGYSEGKTDIEPEVMIHPPKTGKSELFR
jgi:hypothetical protein